MHENIESHLVEKRVFKPAKAFREDARIQQPRAVPADVSRVDQHPEKFWAREATSCSGRTLEESARMEGAVREMVRRREAERLRELSRPASRPRTEPEQGRHHLGRRTRRQAHADLSATAPRGLPVRQRAEAKQHRKGDRVIIYCRWFPKPPSRCSPARASARCTRSSSADSARQHSRPDRRLRRGRGQVITADGGFRRGAIVPLKKNVDDALRGGTSARRVIVFRRAGNDIHIEEGRDVWWHRELEYVDANCPPAALDSEHPSSFSTRAVRPENRRAFCTPPAAICSAIY